MQDCDLSFVCRDENCDRVDLHPSHSVVTHRVKRKKPSVSRRLPWRQPAPRALDHSIAKATSKTYPRHFQAILHEVKEDYGDCNSRTVIRRLGRLVKRGHILRLDLGRSLYAYVRPGSNLANDIELVREQIEGLFASMPDQVHVDMST
jgi:hypothetical protein